MTRTFLKMLSIYRDVVFVILFLCVSYCLPLYITTDTKNVSSVSRFTDENGVQVEKDIAEAIVVQSGESEGSELYDSEEEEDSSSHENSMELVSPGNILDIFTALHTAWREVEKFREENKNQSLFLNQNPQDDRSRRNPFVNDSSTKPFDEPDMIQPLTPAPSTSVSEARYIKGDPLKGYYDFVITEGSYKFWAAFQLATAALVIYSTFAAIYYSKVNPIVGDYDYVEYLGGGRSLPDSYADYEDPTGNEEKNSTSSNITHPTNQTRNNSFWSNLSISNWSLRNINLKNGAKSILDAIDKLS